MKRFEGIAACHGIAVGPCVVFEVGQVHIPRRRIPPEEVDQEIERIRQALNETADQITVIRDNLSNEHSPIFADVLNAHLMVLKDEALIEGVSDVIRNAQLNAEYAFYTHLLSITSKISSSENAYMRDRVGDFMDIGRRVIRNLVGVERPSLADLQEDSVIVAHDLSPSDTAQIRPGRVIAFVTDVGSRTSHTAIMARALGIPAVVGITDFSSQIQNGDLLIVDGNGGEVIVSPTEDVVARYRKMGVDLRQQEQQFAEKVSHLPATTLDGVRIELNGNIEFPWEVDALREAGADGIGLYRTEFLFMGGEILPSEEEQFQAYEEVASRMAPARVVIRTLDLGGDKFASTLDVPTEMNPFLGWRAIRFCLARKDIFTKQLRAILRAGVPGNVGILYPMISSVEELHAANRILSEVRDELCREGAPVPDKLEIGIMVETPAAALTVDILAEDCDFFSIGTNDLIQYTLAVDRVNEKIAYLYQPLHPAVLQLIKRTVDVGHDKGKWVGVCGEMAADPISALVLLSLGVDELSMSCDSLAAVKTIIRSVRMCDLKGQVAKMLSMGSANEVRSWAEHIAREILPDWLSLE